MRKSILFTLAVLITALSYAQTSPVKWTFSSKKLSDKDYEIQITATPTNPWHIYSQTTPEGGPLPTKINFNKNPLVKIEGNLKEKGKLVTKYEEVFDMKVKYFDGNVVFVQPVKLKTNVKTSVSGRIEFMACNEEQCMPPAEVAFTIQLK